MAKFNRRFEVGDRVRLGDAFTPECAGHEGTIIAADHDRDMYLFQCDCGAGDKRSLNGISYPRAWCYRGFSMRLLKPQSELDRIIADARAAVEKADAST